jgi:hypothetical protein
MSIAHHMQSNIDTPLISGISRVECGQLVRRTVAESKARVGSSAR